MNRDEYFQKFMNSVDKDKMQELGLVEFARQWFGAGFLCGAESVINSQAPFNKQQLVALNIEYDIKF